MGIGKIFHIHKWSHSLPEDIYPGLVFRNSIHIHNLDIHKVLGNSWRFHLDISMSLKSHHSTNVEQSCPILFLQLLWYSSYYKSRPSIFLLLGSIFQQSSGNRQAYKKSIKHFRKKINDVILFLFKIIVTYFLYHNFK